MDKHGVHTIRGHGVPMILFLRRKDIKEYTFQGGAAPDDIA